MIIIYTTVDSHKTASKLAKGLVSEGKVLCVNTVNHVQSTYLWKEKIIQSEEVMMYIKVLDAHKLFAMNYLKEHHPYEVPLIATIKLEDIDTDYLQWAKSLFT